MDSGSTENARSRPNPVALSRPKGPPTSCTCRRSRGGPRTSTRRGETCDSAALRPASGPAALRPAAALWAARRASPTARCRRVSRQAPQKKPIWKKTWFRVVAALFVIAAIGSAMSGGDKTDTTAASGSSDAPAAVDGAAPAEEVAAEPAMPGLNQPAADGDFSFVVSGVDCSLTEIGTQYFGTKAQGQFCVVNVAVTNIGDTAGAVLRRQLQAAQRRGPGVLRRHGGGDLPGGLGLPLRGDQPRQHAEQQGRLRRAGRYHAVGDRAARLGLLRRRHGRSPVTPES